MKGRKSILKRLVATCASVALVVGTMAFNVSADVAQSGSSDYIGFDIRSYGFNVYGKSSSSNYMQTTFSNGGYSTFLKVGSNTVYTSSSTPGTPGGMSPTFEYGKDFSVDDASVNVTASINESGKGVLLTYTITNNSDYARTMSVGSCSDCEIRSNDYAYVRSYEDGLSMDDNSGNVFYLLPVSDEFTTMWTGAYGSRFNNITTNAVNNSFTGDSGLCWSWSVDVPAHGTATRTCIISCGEAQALARHTLNFDANGGEGSMSSRTFVDGVESILPANEFYREGYDFLGWSTSADSNDVTYADQGAIALTEDTTLYAVWTRHMDPSTFTAPEGLELTYNGSAQTLVTPGSTSDGTMVYSLVEDGEFSETLPAGTASGTYTVYYKVEGDESHYDSDIGSVEATISPLMVPVTIDGTQVATVSAEDTYSRPAAPTRTGYEFNGWYTDTEGTSEYDFSQVVGINGLDLYTNWTKVSYSLTEGADSTWTAGSTDGVVLRAVRNVNESTTFAHFTGVKVDGYTLDSNAYTAVSGSVIVTLSADYLNTLSTGAHTIELTFDDGDAVSTTLTITAAEITPAATPSPVPQVLGTERAPEATATPTPTTAPSGTPSTGEASNSYRAVIGVILLVAGLGLATRYAIRIKEEN